MNKDILSLINRREGQLLVNANLYYLKNTNLIQDDTYDKWSFELDKLIKQYPDEFNDSTYHDMFVNFDPSSGYYLNYAYPDIENIVQHLLLNRKRNKKGGKQS